MSQEIKVVIVLKDNRGSIGIQAPNCDPVLSTLEGGLEAALERLPGLMEEAQRRWDSNPRYPKADLPAPAPVAVTSQRQPAPQARRQEATQEGRTQPLF